MSVQMNNGMYNPNTGEVIYEVGMPVNQNNQGCDCDHHPHPGYPYPPYPPYPPMPPMPYPPTGGAQGPAGAQGSQGTIGAHGHIGVQGAQGPAGEVTIETGAQGIQGSQGASGVTGIQGTQGIIGAHGHIGVQGAQGPVGAGLDISGVVNSIYELPATAEVGDCYICDGYLYTYAGIGLGDTNTPQVAWKKSEIVGHGVDGAQGATGAQGAQGPASGPQGVQGPAGIANLDLNTFQQLDNGDWSYIGVRHRVTESNVGTTPEGDKFIQYRHDLNCYPTVALISEDGEEIIQYEVDVEYIDLDTVRINFNGDVPSNAILILR